MRVDCVSSPIIPYSGLPVQSIRDCNTQHAVDHTWYGRIHASKHVIRDFPWDISFSPHEAKGKRKRRYGSKKVYFLEILAFRSF